MPASLRTGRLILGLVVFTVLLHAPYLLPNRGNEIGPVGGGREDRGTFVSIAAALNAGAVLYREVYDNKDPLFYYAIAAQLALGGWAQLAFEGLMAAIVCWSAFSLARPRASPEGALLIGGFGALLVVTGAFYIQGATHLPATALTLWALVSASRGQPRRAGLLVGLLAMTKLIVVPVAAAGMLAFLVKHGRRSWIVSIASAIGTVLIVVVFLAIRGELQAYVDVQVGNVQYAQSALMGNLTGLASLAQHLKLAGEGGRFHTAVVSNVLCLTVVAIASRRLAVDWHLVAAGCGTLLASIGVLALTGVWPHHNQILYVSGVIALACVAPLVRRGVELLLPGTVIAVLCIALLLGGGPTLQGTVGLAKAWSNFPTVYASVSATAPGGRALLKVGPEGRYARLGLNSDDMGFMVGTEGWRLACPRFHQYSFQTRRELDPVLECIQGVPTILVAQSLRVGDGPFVTEDWNDFVRGAEQILERDYDCDAATGLRVCSLRSGR